MSVASKRSRDAHSPNHIATFSPSTQDHIKIKSNRSNHLAYDAYTDQSSSLGEDDQSNQALRIRLQSSNSLPTNPVLQQHRREGKDYQAFLNNKSTTDLSDKVMIMAKGDSQ
jgi:hypothetical protein